MPFLQNTSGRLLLFKFDRTEVVRILLWILPKHNSPHKSITVRAVSEQYDCLGWFCGNCWGNDSADKTVQLPQLLECKCITGLYSLLKIVNKPVLI